MCPNTWEQLLSCCLLITCPPRFLSSWSKGDFWSAVGLTRGFPPPLSVLSVMSFCFQSACYFLPKGGQVCFWLSLFWKQNGFKFSLCLTCLLPPLALSSLLLLFFPIPFPFQPVLWSSTVIDSHILGECHLCEPKSGALYISRFVTIPQRTMSCIVS